MTISDGWRANLRGSVRPYTEAAPLAAFFLGISSGAPYAMIGATLTTRLAQYGIGKSAVTAFALTFLAYNFKFLWAPLVDTVRLPLLGRFGQRRSWLWLVGRAGDGRGRQSSGASIPATASPPSAAAAILVGVAGATFDIVIDAYRIELLEPRQLGVGSGMSQYGWRIGIGAAGALALVIAARVRLGRRLCRLRAVRAAGDGRRPGDGRAGAASRAAAAGRGRGGGRLSSARSPSSSGATARWSCCCSS